MLDDLSFKTRKIITDLESKWPVEGWTVNDVHIWPYVRIRIFIHFFMTGGKKVVSSIEGNNYKYGSKVLFTKTKIPFKLFKAMVNLNFFFKGLSHKKLVFFGSHIHRSKHNGVYFNRFFDSMVDFHNLKDDVYMVEFQRVFDKNFNQKSIIPLDKILDQYKLLLKVSSRFKKSTPIVQLEGYDQFLSELDDLYPEMENLQISEKELIQWTNKINKVKGFFKKMFRLVKPSKIIMASYYGFDDLSAAILAAHEQKIKVIDFQHGPQMGTNMAYNSWTKVPQDLFNIMPTEYWTWDVDSMKTINDWAKNTKGIVAKAVGHPYLAYCLKDKVSNNPQLKYILYSLQPEVREATLGDFFPPEILRLMQLSIYPWILRLHPRTNYKEEQIVEFFDTRGVKEENYFFQNSLESPLPESLAQSVVHVTNWSGCLLEARMMGKPTIIIHDFGKYIYQDYIDNDLVYFLNLNESGFTEHFQDYLNKIERRNNSKVLNNIPNPLSL